MSSSNKIMVVDDERGICENVARILKKNNYDIVQASSADEALEKMARQPFSLLISDIVMPGKNGLQLLKLVKDQWPLTKAIMMTAYASTDTAVKAIRMGAVDYIPKPFTPKELRETVVKALDDILIEADVSARERDSINLIDLDIPFDPAEVSKYTDDGYVDTLGPSDMPIVEVKAREPLEGFCETGVMVCDIFKKLGATCKAGIKKGVCPQKKAAKKTASAGKQHFDPKELIGIDQPFSYRETEAITGPEYIRNLDANGFSVPTYEQLKKNIAQLTKSQSIAVDVPFDRDEVAHYTGETYADRLTRSDMPVVEVTASEPLEGFCEVGAMVCDIFKKLGATCKAGTKTAACPQKKAKKRGRRHAAAVDVGAWVGIDQPFAYDEVVAATGTEYINHLVYDGTVQMPYDQLKAHVAGLDAAARQPQASAAKVIQLMPDAPDNRHILVIDDEASVNNNIRKILKKSGYHVDQAFDKTQALDHIGAGAYKLVLLDLKIPGVNGLELLETIRNRQPHAQVIMITGYASIETAVAAARMGAIDYLPKPFTPNEIRLATENAFKLAA